ncbi:MAG: hypothetical protein PHG00_11875 [Methylococcales bacterium]|nr:hypothetical protein [Methylococcales bacterium]
MTVAGIEQSLMEVMGEFIKVVPASEMAKLVNIEKALPNRLGIFFVTGDMHNRLPNTTDIPFEYIEVESILMLLNKAADSVNGFSVNVIILHALS